MLFELTCSLFLLRVVLEQVVGHELDGVLGTLFGALGQSLEEDWHNSLVEVSTDGQVLDVVRVTVIYSLKG
jgi:hypothetical protein